MVSQKYRWDFIGLSTDDKPTSQTSEKVVNGSTYYCSDTSKLYVYCDGTWYERQPLGGGGGTSNFNDLTNRPKYNGTDMTGSTNIPEVQTYTAFTGTDGTSAGTSGLVPAPATTDAGKFLKADGTWDSTGGGGDTVYSSKTTSNSTTGGAVYIGNLGTDQVEVADPTSTDNHYKYFWSLPADNTNLPKNNTINILGEIKGTDSQNYNNTIIGAGSIGESGNTLCTNNIILSCGSFTDRSKVGSAGRSTNSIIIGKSSTIGKGGNSIVIGFDATVNCKSQDYGNVGIGTHVGIDQNIQSSIALGSYAIATRSGELNIGLSEGNNYGYNSTLYRVIGGVHDGQELHDAATVAQGNTLATSAPTTSTVGVLGQFYTDTTNMHTYQCTAISGNTYTWTQRW